MESLKNKKGGMILEIKLKDYLENLSDKTQLNGCKIWNEKEKQIGYVYGVTNKDNLTKIKYYEIHTNKNQESDINNLYLLRDRMGSKIGHIPLPFAKGGKIGFEQLAKNVAEEYIKKGYSKEEAEEIGKKTAGKVYWEQQGRKFDDGGIISDIVTKFNNIDLEKLPLDIKEWLIQVKNYTLGFTTNINDIEKMFNDIYKIIQNNFLKAIKTKHVDKSNDYQAAIDGLKVMAEIETDEKKKEEYKAAIEGLEVLIMLK